MREAAKKKAGFERGGQIRGIWPWMCQGHCEANVHTNLYLKRVDLRGAGRLGEYGPAGAKATERPICILTSI